MTTQAEFDFRKGIIAKGWVWLQGLRMATRVGCGYKGWVSLQWSFMDTKVYLVTRVGNVHMGWVDYKGTEAAQFLFFFLFSLQYLCSVCYQGCAQLSEFNLAVRGDPAFIGGYHTCTERLLRLTCNCSNDSVFFPYQECASQGDHRYKDIFLINRNAMLIFFCRQRNIRLKVFTKYLSSQVGQNLLPAT